MKTKRGSLPLLQDAVNVPVAFAAPFDAKPTIVQCWVLPPTDAGDETLMFIEAVVIRDTITAAGFTAKLGTAIPLPGYELQWLAIL